jgi:excinuclease ABC subunit C
VSVNQRGGAVSMQHQTITECKVWQSMAEQNARLAISQKLAQSATQEHRLQSLIEALDLPKETQRIECFDISHTQGEATVASCVVFDNCAMQSSQYRKFNVTPAVGGDDYAAMKEALTRRAARIAAEEVPRPDVIIIDGGKGQVGIVANVLAEHGLADIVMFGSAKGVERKKGQEQMSSPTATPLSAYRTTTLASTSFKASKAKPTASPSKATEPAEPKPATAPPYKKSTASAPKSGKTY